MATRPTSAIDRINAANGNAYDATNNPGGLAQGGHRQNFVPDLQAGVAVAQWVNDLADEADVDAAAALVSRNQASTFATNASNSATAAAGSATESANSAAALVANSTTSQTISVGSKTFTVQTGRQLGAGQRVTITNDAAPTTRIMYGQVTSYSGTSLVVSVDEVVGSGTYAAWTIRLGGTKGAIGNTGAAAWTTVTEWASGVAYVTGPPASVVTYLGETYVCILSHTSSGSILPTNVTYWRKVAAKGVDGTTPTTASFINIISATAGDLYPSAATLNQSQTFVNISAATGLISFINGKLTLTTNVTFSVSSAPSTIYGRSGAIRIQQDATGGRTASWSTFWDFGPSGPPTLSTAPNAVDYVFYQIDDGGTRAICTFRKGT